MRRASAVLSENWCLAASVDLAYIGVAGDAPELEFTYYGLGQPLDEGTQVVSLLTPKHVEVDPKLAYQVTIEGYPLTDTLVGIMRRVQSVVRMIETGEPELLGVPFVAT